MKKLKATLLLSILAVFAATSLSQAAMVKVARRYNVFEVYGGLSEPHGKYSAVGILDFRDDFGKTYDLDADQVYESTYHLGFNFGQLRNRKLQILVGFQYTKIEQLDRFGTPDLYWQMVPIPFMNQYNIKAGFNYLFTDLAETFAAPFVGAEVMAGLTTMTATDVQTETQLGLTTAVVAGFELKLWGDKMERKFVTLAPQVNYQFLATGDRAKHLNFGGGLKYYFR